MNQRKIQSLSFIAGLMIAGILLFGIATPADAATPTRYERYQAYIHKHYKIAIRQQQRHRIPASITLAQGLLESGVGESYLALAANNHFGIKCAGWKGLSVRKYDDGEYACFRKYLYVADSFEDHSRFLKERTHYKPLFKLAVTDYRGWARGLKQYGYASDSKYADKLIALIEELKLNYYDTAREADPPVRLAGTATPAKTVAAKPAAPKKPVSTAKTPAKPTPRKRK